VKRAARISGFALLWLAVPACRNEPNGIENARPNGAQVKQAVKPNEPKDNNPGPQGEPANEPQDAAKDNDDDWPVIVDDPPEEPRPLAPKVVAAWRASGAKILWQSGQQIFDKMPDLRPFPEMLPCLSYRTARFNAGPAAALPEPNEPFSLNLFGCDLTDDSVKQLARFKNLRRLDLTATRVSDVGVQALPGLPDLRALHLGTTKISNAGLKDVTRIASLRELSISTPGVTEAGLKELSNLKRLQTLDISSVNLSSAGLKHLARCRNLRDLDVGGRIKEADWNLLASLKKLEILRLYRSKLTPARVKGLGALQHLTELNVAVNPELGDAGLAEIGALKNLRILNLQQSDVTDAGLHHLAGLEQLEKLNLRDGKITDAGLVHLARHKSLRMLDLAGTPLTDAGLKTILTFESDRLERVILPRTISPAALAAARKQRPKVGFSN
jgi:hypothetical protein